MYAFLLFFSKQATVAEHDEKLVGWYMGKNVRHCCKINMKPLLDENEAMRELVKKMADHVETVKGTFLVTPSDQLAARNSKLWVEIQKLVDVADKGVKEFVFRDE